MAFVAEYFPWWSVVLYWLYRLFCNRVGIVVAIVLFLLFIVMFLVLLSRYERWAEERRNTQPEPTGFDVLPLVRRDGTQLHK